MREIGGVNLNIMIYFVQSLMYGSDSLYRTNQYQIKNEISKGVFQ